MLLLELSLLLESSALSHGLGTKMKAHKLGFLLLNLYERQGSVKRMKNRRNDDAPVSSASRGAPVRVYGHTRLRYSTFNGRITYTLLSKTHLLRPSPSYYLTIRVTHDVKHNARGTYPNSLLWATLPSLALDV